MGARRFLDRIFGQSYTLLIILSLLWGSSYLWINVLIRAFDPTMTLMLRVFTAGLVLVTLMHLRGARLPKFGKTWLHVLVVAVAADLAPLGMLVWSQQYVSSSVGSVLNATIPLFTLLIAALVFRNERITRSRLIGIVLGFVGVVLLSGTDQSGAGGLLNPGVIAVLTSSIFYGFGFVYARRYLRGNPYGIVALQMLLSLVVVSPIALTMGSVDVAAISPLVIIALLGLGALTGGIGYAVYYLSLERVGPTTTSFATYLSPIVAIAIGWTVLGERLGALGVLGILIVIAGVITAAGGMPIIYESLRARLWPRKPAYTYPDWTEDWSVVA